MLSAVPWAAARLTAIASPSEGTVTRPPLTLLPAGSGSPLNATTPGFQIEVVFGDTNMTASQQAAFISAASRWMQIITGDLPNVTIGGQEIEDLRITATAPAIDGAFGVLGQAGPGNLRSGSRLPATGTMQFDSADVARLESTGQLVNVILHEMGHVLGLGTIWSTKSLITGAGTANPRFTGAQATAEYNAIFATAVTSVPVENAGGSGTADGHWRENVFENELMTGFLGNGSNPLSRVTTAQFADLGYVVNGAAADAYTAPANAAPAIASLTASASSAAGGTSVTLTANGVSDDDGIDRVSFYRETNGTAGLQTAGGTPDALLSSDTASPYTAAATLPAAVGSYTYYAQALDVAGKFGSAVSTAIAVVPPLAVQAVQLNDAAAQRSRISSLTVTFNQPVTLDAGAFTLARRDGTALNTTINVAPASGAASSFVLTFSGSAVIGGSLADGVYDLTIVASAVNPVATGIADLAASYPAEFHRLFGDDDGDGDVDAGDLFQLRSSVNKSTGQAGFKPQFDYDASGAVDNADLLQLRGRLTTAFKGY